MLRSRLFRIFPENQGAAAHIPPPKSGGSECRIEAGCA